MNWLDYLILITLGASMLIAGMRGFLKEVVNLIGWVAAFLIASRFNVLLTPYLTPHLNSPVVAGMAAFVIIFVIVLVMAGIIGWLLRHMADGVGLSWADRSLGALFGLARGVLIVLVGFMIFLSLEYQTPPNGIRESRLAPLALAGAGQLGRMLPDRSALWRRIRDRYDAFRGGTTSVVPSTTNVTQPQRASTPPAQPNQRSPTPPIAIPTSHDQQQLDRLMHQIDESSK
jgi:membrane protein required for colicin V production